MSKPYLPKLHINPERLQTDLDALARLTDPDRPYTRQAFSPLYFQAREWLAKQMIEAGLEVRVDAAANLIGRLHGSEDGMAPLMMGSHIDTVESGGRFDGIIGVLGALEVIRCLQEAHVQLQRSVEVVDFTCEEPTIVGLTPLGSRIMAGDITAKNLEGVSTPSGDPLLDAIDALGGNHKRLDDAYRAPGELAGYIELHIEQGSVLEQDVIPIGAVTAIAAPCRGLITLRGEADHAGATMMNERRDALAGAADVILALENVARNSELIEDTVATVGSIEVHPNMVNIIPGEVKLWVEIRSIDQAKIDYAKQRFESAIQDITERRALTLEWEWLHSETPVQIPEHMQDIVTESCKNLNLPYRLLPSRATHDAARLASIVPVAMVFVPCKDGKSHTPEEWVDLDQIACGVSVLGHALMILDHNLSDQRN